MEREEFFANYIIETKCTIREVAKKFGVSKSTVHNDVSNRLKRKNFSLYEKVKVILNLNFSQKHIRGGLATKLKYQKTKK